MELEKPKDTLREAKDAYWKVLNKGKAKVCPCCDRRGKINPLKMQSAMARILIWLYRRHLAEPNSWTNVPTNAPRWIIQQNVVGKLLRWGLVERMANAGVNRDEKRKCLGTYRITEAGIGFATGGWTVNRTAMMYNNKVLWWDETQITIHEALTDAFDYSKLMAGEDFLEEHAGDTEEADTEEEAEE